MADKPKMNEMLKFALIAAVLDLATFGCFAAFYATSSGNGIWLVAGLVFAFSSFPFYVRVAKAKRESKAR
jgi:hypothetical protein